LGGLTELIDAGRTGALFTAGDAGDLAAKIDRAWSDESGHRAFSRAARAEFETRYTAARQCETLLEIYERAGADSR
jgi:glycosyltransferase involved in cell wall biosynthesis